MTSGSGARRATGTTQAKNPVSPMSVRMWQGMRLSEALGLLAEGRLDVSRSRFYVAWFLVWLGAINSVLALVQRARFGRRIQGARLAGPPIFVVGHWRSGTTLLHELLVLDERFTAPTTYECFAPEHFLVSRRLLGPIARVFTPARRPMDDMPVGLDLPQEDEFALLAMGLPSPYRMMAFPNQGRRDVEYLDFVGVPEPVRRRWQEGLTRFMQTVTVRRAAPLVLKSPPHLGRLPVLLEIFPDARFVHIVRDPHAVFQSTVRLWDALTDAEALQDPTGDGVEDLVFDLFERLYRSFEAARDSVPAGQLTEVRYEDLIRDPSGEMGRVYDALGLGQFERVRPHVEAYFAERSDYQASSYPRDPALEAEIDRRWGPFMRGYGYGAPAASGGSAGLRPSDTQVA